MKAERLRPWRDHNWHHLHDPERFLERARPVLPLDGQALSFLKEGVWLLCLDEKTSSQAREGEEAPRPAKRGRPPLQESRYQRRGARNLFAGLSVGDGKVSGTCRAHKGFADFQAFLQEVIIPEALRRQVHTVKLILDNGPTHAPKPLERWLPHLPVVEEGKRTFQVFWLPANASWLDQIEIGFSLFQRQLLPPNHFPSTADLEQAIADFIADSNQTAKPITWTYTVEKLERKLEQRINQKSGHKLKQKLGS